MSARRRLEFLCAAFAVMRDALQHGDGRLALAALVRVAQRVSPQDANEVIRSLVITKVLSHAGAAQMRTAAGLHLQTGAA